MMKSRIVSLVKLQVFTGAFLINVPLCLTMIYGNVATYIYSLFYGKLQLSTVDLDAAWMNGICLTASAAGALLLDVIRSQVGLRLTTALGIVLCASGFLLTFFTVRHSPWTTCATYIVLGGLGDGIAMPATVLFVAGWFEKSTGLALALIGASSGIGGFAFNHLFTAYINPENLSPDVVRGEMTYFSQTELVDRVPASFLIVGGITAGLQVIGFFLLREPPPSSSVKAPHQREHEAKRIKQHREPSYYHSLGPDESSSGGRRKYDERAEKEEMTSHSEIRVSSDDNSDVDRTPKQVLKTETFYIVWFSSFAEALGLLIVSTYYKMFGQLWIENDKLLASIGGLSSLLTVIARPLCGHLFDVCGVKNTLMTHLALTSVFLSVWYFTPRFQWWFFVWTNILISFISNVFVMYPIAVLKLFGRECYASNLFLVQTSMVVVMLALPSLLTYLLSTCGWFWLFTFGNAVAFVSFLLTVVRMPA